MDDILNKIFPQNCGDSLKVTEIVLGEDNRKRYKCVFLKYPYEIICYKQKIKEGSVVNPRIEQEEFINKEWPQKCGDTIRIIEKTNIKKNSHYLFKCSFIKYPFEKLCTKKEIILGTIQNPQIEIEEFANKIWLQNCGDSLKVLRKTEKKKGTNYLWECEFIKYPYKVITSKDSILQGACLNPRIEIEEFRSKIWLQNCGDSLKIIDKRKNSQLYEVEFIKFYYKTLAEKGTIINGEVDNPEVRKRYINTQWIQKCNDIFCIQDVIYNKGEGYLYKGTFLKYPYESINRLSCIKNGNVFNQNAPYLNKDSFLKFYKKHFEKEKKNLFEITQAFNEDGYDIKVTFVGQQIVKLGVTELVDYFPTASKPEKDLRFFVKSLNKNTLDKSTWTVLDNKQEIDIYIPNLRFGIEFNGNYWHSDIYKSSNYHQEKSLLAQSKGISLVHIFEYEWLEKQEIIKSLIKSKLGIFDKKIGARKCTLKELDYKTYAKFCNENHLQGEAGAVVKLGLFYKEELVQTMSFSKPRFTDNFEWEIIRECSKQGYLILGGKKKLWSYFIKKWIPKNCLSYCDFSKFTGYSYRKLGFRQERLNKPGFVWWNSQTNEIYWRNPYRHQELKQYNKIYDCGQLVFTWFNKF